MAGCLNKDIGRDNRLDAESRLLCQLCGKDLSAAYRILVTDRQRYEYLKKQTTH